MQRWLLSRRRTQSHTWDSCGSCDKASPSYSLAFCRICSLTQLHNEGIHLHLRPPGPGGRRHLQRLHRRRLHHRGSTLLRGEHCCSAGQSFLIHSWSSLICRLFWWVDSAQVLKTRLNARLPSLDSGLGLLLFSGQATGTPQ